MDKNRPFLFEKPTKMIRFFVCWILVSCGNPILAQEDRLSRLPLELQRVMTALKSSKDTVKTVFDLWPEFADSVLEVPSESVSGKPVLDYLVSSIEATELPLFPKLQKNSIPELQNQEERNTAVAVYGLFADLLMNRNRKSDDIPDLLLNADSNPNVTKTDWLVCLAGIDLLKEAAIVRIDPAQGLGKWKEMARVPNPVKRITAYTLFSTCACTSSEQNEFYLQLGAEESEAVLRFGLRSLRRHVENWREIAVQIAAVHKASNRVKQFTIVNETID